MINDIDRRVNPQLSSSHQIATHDRYEDPESSYRTGASRGNDNDDHDDDDDDDDDEEGGGCVDGDVGEALSAGPRISLAGARARSNKGKSAPVSTLGPLFLQRLLPGFSYVSTAQASRGGILGVPPPLGGPPLTPRGPQRRSGPSAEVKNASWREKKLHRGRSGSGASVRGLSAGTS
ncbi:hypothetical protein KM043_016697 [Ampulex compressa]|nr:hypothetical protein KM043_016697 [Ampulex compressa]